MSEPVHTDVVQVVVRSAARSHPCTGPSDIISAWPAPVQYEVGAGHLVQRRGGHDGQTADVVGDRPGLLGDEHHLGAGQPLSTS